MDFIIMKQNIPKIHKYKFQLQVERRHLSISWPQPISMWSCKIVNKLMINDKKMI